MDSANKIVNDGQSYWDTDGFWENDFRVKDVRGRVLLRLNHEPSERDIAQVNPESGSVVERAWRSTSGDAAWRQWNRRS